jgi:hypothetical protein
MKRYFGIAALAIALAFGFNLAINVGNAVADYVLDAEEMLAILDVANADMEILSKGIEAVSGQEYRVLQPLEEESFEAVNDETINMLVAPGI